LLYEELAQAQAEQRYKELDARQQQKALADHLQQFSFKNFADLEKVEFLPEEDSEKTAPAA